jgi:hypothetical protein
MFGVLIAVLVTLAAIGFVRPALLQSRAITDPAAQIGLSGMIGLGWIGTLIFFLGLVNISAAVTGVVGIATLSGIAGWIRFGKDMLPRFRRPEGLDLLFPLAIGLGLLMALFGVLAPSTTSDWDSLAYHLAVPKLWLADGAIHPIPFIHQSNFPFAVDSLFFIGLKFTGQAGAKAFIWCFTLLGCLTLFGIGRQRYGERAGWWAALVFSMVPIVLWQSGTAYIDVPHGLFAGLGLVFACWWVESDEKGHAMMAAIMLGFALGTKYTGLQTLAVAGLVALVGAILLKKNLRPVIVMGLIALAIGCPWHIKNAIWKENPVFPFFYSKLGGKDWDQRRAEIYTREQNSFGVGRGAPPEGSIEPLRIGHSVMGLAYQPGRYVNPQQTQGGGDPMGATGVAVIGAFMLALVAGFKGRFERAILAAVLISFAIWFVLTQQSRYIVSLAVLLSLLAGLLAVRTQWKYLMGAVAVLQAVASLYLLHTRLFSDQLQVVLGKVSTEEYQTRRIGFFEAAQTINQLPAGSKVALYDEVFGYLLDRPYFWANPGHSTIIPYDSMNTGADFAAEMRKLGFTHIYMNLRAKSPEDAHSIWMALQGQAMSQADRDRLFNNWETKYTPLILDANALGYLHIENAFGNPEMPKGVLLAISSDKRIG